jgi:hypothetical protein
LHWRVSWLPENQHDNKEDWSLVRLLVHLESMSISTPTWSAEFLHPKLGCRIWGAEKSPRFRYFPAHRPASGCLGGLGHFSVTRCESVTIYCESTARLVCQLTNFVVRVQVTPLALVALVDVHRAERRRRPCSRVSKSGNPGRDTEPKSWDRSNVVGKISKRFARASI